MKIGIFGMGAVGCSLLNELHDYDDLYILGDKKRIDKYNNGFNINDNLIYPKCSTSIKPDLIIVCVKNYDLVDALKDISNFVGAKTVILPLLNGIEAHDILKSYFPDNNVLYGVINVESNKKDNITKTSKIINLQFGEEYNYQISSFLKEFDDILSKYDVKHGIYPDMKKRVWLKWMLNMGINPISALLNATYKDMSHPALKELLHNIFDEVYLVAKAYNIDINEADLLETKERCEAFKSERVTSLTIDFYNNDKNEFESFTPTLIRLAEAKGIDLPVNKTICKLLNGFPKK